MKLFRGLFELFAWSDGSCGAIIVFLCVGCLGCWRVVLVVRCRSGAGGWVVEFCGILSCGEASS